MTDKALDGKALGKVIQIDEKQIQFHLDQKVRRTVEETLNAMLDKEAEALDNLHSFSVTSVPPW